ncbi:hypothetical protein PENFLA_c002G09571 [Penicillium flavigenum]|uniref:Uncharacterized protein n=1 Tax=Penicillium flavigenum TaxID=254877 RepID=A0A1V6TY63_9EURO|nr:hypothetical protein PENFLA_c002G09571 [Penicillium flavigenum]
MSVTRRKARPQYLLNRQRRGLSTSHTTPTVTLSTIKMRLDVVLIRVRNLAGLRNPPYVAQSIPHIPEIPQVCREQLAESSLKNLCDNGAPTKITGTCGSSCGRQKELRRGTRCFKLFDLPGSNHHPAYQRRM